MFPLIQQLICHVPTSQTPPSAKLINVLRLFCSHLRASIPLPHEALCAHIKGLTLCLLLISLIVSVLLQITC